MWKCGSVEVWKCGSVEVWKCGKWKCGSVELTPKKTGKSHRKHKNRDKAPLGHSTPLRVLSCAKFIIASGQGGILAQVFTARLGLVIAAETPVALAARPSPSGQTQPAAGCACLVCACAAAWVACSMRSSLACLRCAALL